MILQDGQGSRYNQVTTDALVRLLESVYKKPEIYSKFLTLLPVSGMQGTLKRRMLNLKATVWAKTGSMHDASSLAGYLKSATGTILIFAMITNYYDGSIQKLHHMEDHIIYALWKNAARSKFS